MFSKFPHWIRRNCTKTQKLKPCQVSSSKWTERGNKETLQVSLPRWLQCLVLPGWQPWTSHCLEAFSIFSVWTSEFGTLSRAFSRSDNSRFRSWQFSHVFQAIDQLQLPESQAASEVSGANLGRSENRHPLVQTFNAFCKSTGRRAISLHHSNSLRGLCSRQGWHTNLL